MIEFFQSFESIWTTISTLEIYNGFVFPELFKNYIFLYGIAFAVYAVLFTLEGIGLRKLAINAGRKDSWKAFVPFLNTYLFGELAGECHFVTFKIKKPSLWLAISEGVVCIGYILSQICNVMLHPYIRVFENYVDYVGYESAGLTWAYKMDEILGYIFPIIELLYIFFFVLVVISFFRKYATRNAAMFSIVSVFINPAKAILIFAVRNNKAIDYKQYIRTQREAYIRRQQQYYNNPYNNPYGTPYNKPEGPSYSQDDPFSEFSKNGQSYSKEEKKSSNISEKDRKQNDDFFGA